MKTCECGCGRAVPLSKKTSIRDGTVRGHPVRFLRGHRPALKLKKYENSCQLCGGDVVAKSASRRFCDACIATRRREKGRLSKRKDRQTPEYKAKYRAWTLQKKYGLTLDDFNAMFAMQGHKCALCNRTTSGKKDWSVDHDHDTGAVRGILCNTCNLMIGLSGDNRSLLLKAAEYLSGRQSPEGH